MIVMSLIENKNALSVRIVSGKREDVMSGRDPKLAKVGSLFRMTNLG